MYPTRGNHVDFWAWDAIEKNWAYCLYGILPDGEPIAVNPTGDSLRFGTVDNSEIGRVFRRRTKGMERFFDGGLRPGEQVGVNVVAALVDALAEGSGIEHFIDEITNADGLHPVPFDRQRALDKAAGSESAVLFRRLFDSVLRGVPAFDSSLSHAVVEAVEFMLDIIYSPTLRSGTPDIILESVEGFWSLLSDAAQVFCHVEMIRERVVMLGAVGKVPFFLDAPLNNIYGSSRRFDWSGVLSDSDCLDYRWSSRVKDLFFAAHAGAGDDAEALWSRIVFEETISA